MTKKKKAPKTKAAPKSKRTRASQTQTQVKHKGTQTLLMITPKEKAPDLLRRAERVERMDLMGTLQRRKKQPNDVNKAALKADLEKALNKAVTPLCKRHGCILEIGCYRRVATCPTDGGASSNSGGGLPHREPHLEPHPEPSGSSASD